MCYILNDANTHTINFKLTEHWEEFISCVVLSTSARTRQLLTFNLSTSARTRQLLTFNTTMPEKVARMNVLRTKNITKSLSGFYDRISLRTL